MVTTGLYTTSSLALTLALGWESLHTRRLLAQCTLFHKIHYHHLVSIPFPPAITPAAYIGRHDHNLKYVIPETTIDVYKFSFFPRTVRTWNHLPGHVVEITNPSTFREAALSVIRAGPTGFEHKGMLFTRTGHTLILLYIEITYYFLHHGTLP